MPVIWFLPKVDYKADPEMYMAPVYKTGLRKGVLTTTGQSSNFIIAVECPTKTSPDVWTRRAAALLCQLND